MKKRILLIDESLTVQKVVALTLDKGSYQVLYARNRQEVIRTVVDQPVDLILLSENAPGLAWSSFPKELESWLGTTTGIPPVVLISGHEMKEAKHFIAVLKKPFSPQSLQYTVENLLGDPQDTEATLDKERTQMSCEDVLQSTFNRKFSDEQELVRQTFEEEIGENLEPQQVSGADILDWQTPPQPSSSPKKAVSSSTAELWATTPSKSVVSNIPGSPKESTQDLWGTQEQVGKSTLEEFSMGSQDNALLTSEDSMAYKAFLQSEVKSKIQNQDLEMLVKNALSELMPPIVERLVQERLDQLLKDHEESLAS
jgi:CheY-like chemotaxis protein